MSFMTEKWMVLIPVVEGSVPEFEAGISSARRKPVCTFVDEGVKIDLSFMVTSTALVPLASNSEVLTDGKSRTSLHCRFAPRLYFGLKRLALLSKDVKAALEGTRPSNWRGHF